MTFQMPDDADASGMYGVTLPERSCKSCGRRIPRRKHRVTIRASWLETSDTLCPSCWHTVCSWASRFALEQMKLDV